MKGCRKAPACDAKPLIFAYLNGARMQCLAPLKKLAGHVTGSLHRRTYRSRTSGHESVAIPFGVFQEGQGKKKHININKFAGLSRDRVGAKILFMCFLGVILMGEKNT